MSRKKIQDSLQRRKQRSFLNKDFDGFRSDLLLYANTYYSDYIQDFSDASLGGLFLDMAAYVGDVMSYYMDHQFNELSIETAVEESNIAKLIETSGVKIIGPSPAFCTVDFTITVPADKSGGAYVPRTTSLPIIKEGTTLLSKAGPTFELLEDLDFSIEDDDGELIATYKASVLDAAGGVQFFEMTLPGPCSSALSKTTAHNIGGSFKQFITITISDMNVTEVVEVKDADGNQYYEVEYLTQDVVFKRVLNTASDHPLVPETIEIIPAPRRYTTNFDRISKLTTLQFGAGDENTLDDDIIPDPSELAIPLYGKRTMSRFSIDPNSMLETRSLGVAPQATVLNIRFRHGGGLHHNVPANSITVINGLRTVFDPQAGNTTAAIVRGSLRVNNPKLASGGEGEPSLDDLKRLVKTFRSSQSRIVTKEDLVARVYTMPSQFGRVFRLAVKDNPANPLATRLFIISRNSSGQLITSPDSLKKNLRTYLNQYRLVSDAIDIFDAEVIDMTIIYEVVLDAIASKAIVIQDINYKLKTYFNIKNWQIDQPIIRSDLVNIIVNTEGIISISSLRIKNITGEYQDRMYSTKTFNVKLNTVKKIIIPPSGGIFEIRYPDSDIIGNAT